MLSKESQRDLLALLRSLPQKRRNEFCQSLRVLFRRAGLKNVKSDKKPRDRVKKLVRNAATWLVCAKCTAKVVAAFWWF